MTKSARKKAVMMLMNIEKDTAYVNIEMNKLRSSGEHSILDVRFIGEIVNGVIKHKLTIDYVISIHSQTKLKKISPYILAVLRSGVYQILYMDKVPVSAAVNESVNLVKKSSVGRLSGFVNAVLRKVSDADIKFEEPYDAQKISLEFSFPEWMINNWIKQYGIEFTIKLAKSLNSHPDLFVRCNRLKCDVDVFKCSLEEEAVEYEEFRLDGFSGFDTCFKIKTGAKAMTDLDSFKKGYFYVQDPAASIAAYVAKPSPGDFVVDMCSAPGGKSLFMAELMENDGCIHAFDIYEHKIKLVSENAKKYGAEIIHASLSDATVYNPELAGKADRVLCDVPCSGFGIIRKKPDIKYSRKEADISSLTGISSKILDNAAKYLKENGILVFSTCTINKTENEDMCMRFLESHKNFSLLPFGDNNCFEKGFKLFHPDSDGTDGFFVAKFIKRSNAND